MCSDKTGIFSSTLLFPGRRERTRVSSRCWHQPQLPEIECPKHGRACLMDCRLCKTGPRASRRDQTWDQTVIKVGVHAMATATKHEYRFGGIQKQLIKSLALLSGEIGPPLPHRRYDAPTLHPPLPTRFRSRAMLVMGVSRHACWSLSLWSGSGWIQRRVYTTK